MKKYLRKIYLFSAIILMLAAIAIGMSVIFAVKNVNVTINSYRYDSLIASGYSQEEALEEEQSTASQWRVIFSKSFRGKLMASVSEESVAVIAENGGYKLESVELVYPCTLNITISERAETFAVANGELYDIYDSEGVYIRTGENVNSLDNSPNIIVSHTGNGKGSDISSFIVDIASYSETFKQYFTRLRTITESIEVVYEGAGDEAISHLIFGLRSGIDIRIINFEEETNEKIYKAYECFCSLDGIQKTVGEVYAIGGYDGDITAVYQKTKY